MIKSINVEEMNKIGKEQVAAFEYWARNLIHNKLLETYGTDYLNYKIDDENYLFKSSIRTKVGRLIEKEPCRFTRQVDAFFIEDIIYTLCRSDFYSDLFKVALDYSFPKNRESVMFYLDQLIEPRNKLAHSNPISFREFEKLVCYINDFITGMKEYYISTGVDKMWNVPSILRIVDSLGNQIMHDGGAMGSTYSLENIHQFNVGDTYKLSIEIDPSYSEDQYDVCWKFMDQRSDNKKEFTITFTESHITAYELVDCRISSKKSWHKYNGFDDRFFLSIAVLPNE